MRAIGVLDKEAPVEIDPHHRGQLTLETQLNIWLFPRHPGSKGL
jgi:hypothetical protein